MIYPMTGNMLRRVGLATLGPCVESETYQLAIYDLRPYVTYSVEFRLRLIGAGGGTTGRLEVKKLNSMDPSRASSFTSPIYLGNTAGWFSGLKTKESNFLVVEVETVEADLFGDLAIMGHKDW